MRKLLINGRFLAGPITAVNSVAKELSFALYRASVQRDLGWTVEIVVPRALETWAQTLDVPITVHGTHNGILWEQLELPALRKRGVVLNLFNTVPIFGRGYVAMLHDANVMKTPESYPFLTRLWRTYLSRQAGKLGNNILTISDYSRRSLLECGIGRPNAFGVVPNGLGNVGRVVPDPKIFDRLKLNGSGHICIGLSSTLPHKNIGTLLHAFSRPEMRHHELILFGKATLKDFRALGFPVPRNVHFAGYVSDQELAALYEAALAVCVPSTEEGFGLPALEGMAHSTVAVVSNAGSLPEVVGDAGVIVCENSPAAWAQEINHLANDQDLVFRLEEAGRERAAQFTWDAAAQQAFHLLDNWYPDAG